MEKAKHLVLLPGLDGSGLLFEAFVESCFGPDQYTIISYPTDFHIPYRELAEYVISYLPKDKSILLLGESYSGPVAIQLALKPELNIVSLILVATFCYYPKSLLKVISFCLPYKYLLQLPIPDFLLRFMCFDKNVDAKLISVLRKCLTITPVGIMSQRMADGIRIDVRQQLKNLTIPCTYIKAKHDKLVSGQAALEIKKMNSAVKIIEVDGPHFILQTRVKDCCTIIKKLLYQ